MEIKNDEELALAVEAVSDYLQSISNYLKDNPEKSAKFKFPRKYLNTVHNYQSKFSWIRNFYLSKNIAYHYQFIDVLRWIGNSTDLYGPVKNVLYKHAIVISGSIAEAFVTATAKKLEYVESKFPGRIKRLNRDGIISNKLLADLNWLWDLRNGIHLHLIEETEHESYKVSSVKKSFKIVKSLETELTDHFEQLDFEEYLELQLELMEINPDSLL